MIMENKLRIINNLDNISENNNVTLEADLVCDCGNKYFKIYHSGKQTKGIFAPYLIQKDNQITIEAKCTCCEHSIIIFDSNIDGTKRTSSDKVNRQLFNILKDTYSYKIHLMYNYWENNFKTNLYEDCFIEISNSKFKKPRRLYEGW